ncbi:hypothetical protein [Salinarimonas ramus]|uniref:Uncharacterized protein n=1 Tax=Salinarimonas ramus TaxID=690164 RepID=A0A917VAA6_9HYPH|nr:hypothetical protein [Salinarimonas ramus]GGK55211.1 hypothetical protein GCM10011322_47370 [Salinarimonas ramus]
MPDETSLDILASLAHCPRVEMTRRQNRFESVWIGEFASSKQRGFEAGRSPCGHWIGLNVVLPTGTGVQLAFTLQESIDLLVALQFAMADALERLESRCGDAATS